MSGTDLVAENLVLVLLGSRRMDCIEDRVARALTEGLYFAFHLPGVVLLFPSLPVFSCFLFSALFSVFGR